MAERVSEEEVAGAVLVLSTLADNRYKRATHTLLDLAAERLALEQRLAGLEDYSNGYDLQVAAARRVFAMELRSELLSKFEKALAENGGEARAGMTADGVAEFARWIVAYSEGRD